MGYRGKVKEQEKARALRAQNRTLADIAQILGVSKSVSLFVRDVPFTPTLRLRGPHRRPHPAHEAKLRQIDQLNREGLERIGALSDEAFFVAGVALYAGEGSKTDGEVRFSNSDPGNGEALLCMVPPILRHRRAALAWTALSPPRTRPQRGTSILVGGCAHPDHSVPQGVARSSGSEHPSKQA
jgi:hypothetical protein